MQTTNAARLVRALGIHVELVEYEVDESDLSAGAVALKIGFDPDRVWKTLVVRGERTGPFLCVIPGTQELDLRKAAKAAGDRKVEMLPQRELEPLTGYRRGGCSPVGTKRKLPVLVDETISLFESVSVSAGLRGLQMIIAPEDLLAATEASTADLV